MQLRPVIILSRLQSSKIVSSIVRTYCKALMLVYHLTAYLNILLLFQFLPMVQLEQEKPIQCWEARSIQESCITP